MALRHRPGSGSFRQPRAAVSKIAERSRVAFWVCLSTSKPTDFSASLTTRIVEGIGKPSIAGPSSSRQAQGSLRCTRTQRFGTSFGLGGAILVHLRAGPFLCLPFSFWPIIILHDGDLAERGVLRTAACVVGSVSAAFGGTLVNWVFALPIALAIVLVLVHLLAAGEVATFLDQLTISGIVAFGIVKAFFA